MCSWKSVATIPCSAPPPLPFISSRHKNPAVFYPSFCKVQKQSLPSSFFIPHSQRQVFLPTSCQFLCIYHCKKEQLTLPAMGCQVLSKSIIHKCRIKLSTTELPLSLHLSLHKAAVNPSASRMSVLCHLHIVCRKKKEKEHGHQIVSLLLYYPSFATCCSKLPDTGMPVYHSQNAETSFSATGM